MARRYIIAIVALSCTLVASASADDTNQGSFPGAQTAAGIMASSADGLGRYLDPNGPIQPAIAALGTLPTRGAEQLNRGISRISSGLHNQAQRLSRSAGQNGQIRMPGLDGARSMMPESLSRMGQMVQDGVSQKNRFIMGQARRGVESANRLDRMMSVQASGPISGPVESAENMLGNAGSSLRNGASQLRGQAQQQLGNVRSQVGEMGQSMQGLGQDLFGQVMDLSKTLANGVTGVFGQMTRTGQEVFNQMQNNHRRNMETMSQLVRPLRSMGSDMQGNLNNLAQPLQQFGQQAQQFGQSAMQRAQEAAQQAQQFGQRAAQEGQQLGQQAQQFGQSAMQRAQEAAQQAQQFGQTAAQQGQTHAREATERAQQLGQNVADQARNFGRSASQKARELAESAAHQAQQGASGAISSGQQMASELANGATGNL